MSLAQLDVSVRYSAMRWNAALSRAHASELPGAVDRGVLGFCYMVLTR